ncbi:MAG: hypothetical protein KDB61_13305 [Planctomycetes bacterium]|nr:hypothetical protein [Planctomycetota bacterium]
MKLLSNQLPLTLAALAGSVTLAVTFAAPAVAQEKQAIKAGTIITMDGAPIQNGVILMDGTRVLAVGPADQIEIPWDAEVTDAPDMVAMPGFVEAHTNSGIDRANETLDVTPFFDVQDSINPVDFYFEDCLRFGITTINVQQGNNTVIAAMGAVVKPWGMTVDAQLVMPQSGVKMSVSPKAGKSAATQAATLRESAAGRRWH